MVLEEGVLGAGDLRVVVDPQVGGDRRAGNLAKRRVDAPAEPAITRRRRRPRLVHAIEPMVSSLLSAFVSPVFAPAAPTD